MNRAAFLKRMVFAALACGFLDSWVPEIRDVGGPSFSAGDHLTIETPFPFIRVGDVLQGRTGRAVGTVTRVAGSFITVEWA